MTDDVPGGYHSDDQQATQEYLSDIRSDLKRHISDGETLLKGGGWPEDGPEPPLTDPLSRALVEQAMDALREALARIEGIAK